MNQVQDRKYQNDCIAAVDAGWENFCRQLVVAPGGAGKTIIFCKMSANEVAAGGRVLILVDQRKLARQTVKKLRFATGLNCDLEMGKFHANLQASVVVANIDSIDLRLSKYPQDHFSLVIADEADLSLSAMWQRVLKHFDGTANVCGFTATPFRADKRDLGEYYQNIPFQISLRELIKLGYLAPITIRQLPITIDLSAARKTGQDFDEQEMADAITPHFHEVAKQLKLHAAFRRTLIFVPLVATSKKLVEVLKSHGLSAEHIDGNSEGRADDDDDEIDPNSIEARFERGEFDILVNSQLMGRGIDIPIIDCVLNLSPTKSKARYIQRIVRGTRLAESKHDLLVLDVLYESGKLVCRPAHLVCETQEEADAITEVQEREFKGKSAPNGESESNGALSQMDLLGTQSVVQAQRERSLRLKLEEQANKKPKHVSADDFILKHGTFEQVDYEPTMKWQAAEATKEQKSILKRNGVDPKTVKDFGHASMLISIIDRVTPVKMASEQALNLMMRLRKTANAAGIYDFSNVTQAQAGRFFAELKKQKTK